MADKIDEIMESGHLRKLDHIGEDVPVLELFTNIWGAGAKTAHLWYQQVKHLSKTCISKRKYFFAISIIFSIIFYRFLTFIVCGGTVFFANMLLSPSSV